MDWYFKFTDNILKKINDIQIEKKLEKHINNMQILKENQMGKIGFKKHQVKLKYGLDFKLLKLVGLQSDDEIYSSLLY